MVVCLFLGAFLLEVVVSKCDQKIKLCKLALEPKYDCIRTSTFIKDLYVVLRFVIKMDPGLEIS